MRPPFSRYYFGVTLLLRISHQMVATILALINICFIERKKPKLCETNKVSNIALKIL
ncbi:MAG: hypothetical protein H6R13_3351 [Proteobacteria bacterium]|nr:hypothetical protein [Pseudomonadota bacterium]